MPGPKRKSQGDASSAATAAGSGDVLYLIQCSRSSYVEEFDEDLYVDCHGDEHQGVEELVRDAASKFDGTWMYNTSAPGCKQQQGNGSGIMLFRTLEAANKQAAV